MTPVAGAIVAGGTALADTLAARREMSAADTVRAFPRKQCEIDAALLEEEIV